jgi:8-oxo-dGTP pyrophosphatase MutT (NUDIX family)
MRAKIWVQLGKLTFWLGWPVLWFYLRHGWRTRVLVVADDQLLMVKSWLGSGSWGLPGGGLHNGEQPKAGALRELREETGLKLKPNQLKLLYQDRALYHGLSFRYYCFVVELSKVQAIHKQYLEISQAAWRPINELSQAEVTGACWQALTAWKQA